MNLTTILSFALLFTFAMGAFIILVPLIAGQVHKKKRSKLPQRLPDTLPAVPAPEVRMPETSFSSPYIPAPATAEKFTEQIRKRAPEPRPNTIYRRFEVQTQLLDLMPKTSGQWVNWNAHWQ